VKKEDARKVQPAFTHAHCDSSHSGAVLKAIQNKQKGLAQLEQKLHQDIL